jgi:tetratricopeptide (TPR) repeat protein
MKIILLHFFLLFLFCSQAQTHFTRAHRLIQNEELKKAEVILDSCLVANYQKDSTYFYKGLAAIKAGNREKCKEYCTLLSKQFPKFGEVHYLKGLFYFQTEKYGKSADEFEKVLKDNPKDINALFDQSLALGLMEDYSDAIKDLDKCIALDSNFTKAYYAKAYWDEFTGNYTDAITNYLHTIRLDPKNFDAYFGLAFIYQTRKENTKACEVISKAIAEGSQIAEELKANFCN